MKIGDMPAYPVGDALMNGSAINSAMSGLTIRQELEVRAMQGFLSSINYCRYSVANDEPDIIGFSKSIADALIKSWENENEQHSKPI